MPDPVAKITLQNNRTYRGVFAAADDLRNAGTPTDGDLAQVYGLSRYFRYDGASTSADNGTTVIQPAGVVTGRWVSNTVNISGADYVEIPLDGSLSDPGDGALITAYEWVLVDEPSGGVAPSVILDQAGAAATLKIPIGPDWRPGGVFVFLRVTNDVGTVSANNPFSPLTSPLSSFQLISATPNSGFLIPAAGTRNWHLQYRDTFIALDEFLLTAGGGSSSTQTRSNKRISPTGTTSGLKSVVPGVILSFTPDSDSYVRVSVNGLAVELGDGDDGAACYFADPGDALTAKPIKDLVQNDILVWNGPVAGYELDTEDVVELEYQVFHPEPI